MSHFHAYAPSCFYHLILKLLSTFLIVSLSLSFSVSYVSCIMAVRTYVFHMLRIYIMILCNWLILWQKTLYLYMGRLRMCLNTSRNHVSRSSVEAFKSVQERKRWTRSRTLSPVTIWLNRVFSILVQLVYRLTALKAIILYV